MVLAQTDVLSITRTQDISTAFGDVIKTPQSSLADAFVVVDIPETKRKQDHALPQWRPAFHIMPPHSWMNDPCAPSYNSATKQYHLGFQWNPRDCIWGNMSWGSAISSDMISWDVASRPSLEPTADSDQFGVFTGGSVPSTYTEIPTEIMTMFYTSAQRLPISYELPYHRTSEQVHMATSKDMGRSWQRHPSNPILSEPPLEYSVTGWRDPFISPWKCADLILDDGDEPFLYAIVAGGIRETTPTVFLYRIRTNALDKWESIGSIIDIGLNFNPSRWTGDFGINWEVANILSFPASNSRTRDFFIMGVEGIDPPDKSSQRSRLATTHMQKWFCGTLGKTGNTTKLRYNYGGTLDHGCFYAANSFWDPCAHEYIIFGWIMEEDLPLSLVRDQNWTGVVSIPRVVKLQTLEGVVCSMKSDLEKITNIEVEADDNGTFTVRTLGCVPDPRLSQLRLQKISIRSMPLEPFYRALVRFPGDSCRQWELKTAFDISSSVAQIGFYIAHSADFSQRTQVSLHCRAETLIIDRSNSTLLQNINVSKEIAPHTLFIQRQASGAEKLEHLKFHVYYDGSVLEVFVNGRTAITTRIYPSSGTCAAIQPFVEYVDGQEGHDRARLLYFDAWALRPAVTQIQN